MSAKEPTPIPAGTIKPDPPPAPPRKRDPLIAAPELDATASDLAKTFRQLDAARDENVRQANQPSAVEVATVAAVLTRIPTASGWQVRSDDAATRDAVRLIAEAERQLGEHGGAGG